VIRFFPALLLFILLGCTSREPSWVYNYKPKKGEVCGVGTAGIHIRGFAYQRATAIARAIDEIARQKGVTVSTQLEHFMESSSSGAYSSLRVYSVQTTEGQTIRARIVETYYDRERQLFHVLMCEER